MLILLAAATAAIVGLLSRLAGLQSIWPGVIIAFVFVMIVGSWR